MKPTDNQKKVIQALVHEIQAWDNNDIDSPSNESDVGIYISNLDMYTGTQELLQSLLGDILSIVQEYK